MAQLVVQHRAAVSIQQAGTSICHSCSVAGSERAQRLDEAAAQTLGSLYGIEAAVKAALKSTKPGKAVGCQLSCVKSTAQCAIAVSPLYSDRHQHAAAPRLS